MKIICTDIENICIYRSDLGTVIYHVLVVYRLKKYNNEFVIGPVPFGKHLIAAATGLCTTKAGTVSSSPVSLRLLSNSDIHRKIGNKNNTF